MRIAVFADIHGNPYATRAVLDAIAKNGLFDAVVMAGDVCSGGSDPAASVDMLQPADVQAVYGNADEFIFAPQKEPPDEIYRARWYETVQGSRWAAEKLGEDRVKWLRELPFELRFSPTENAQDDLLVVHANPKNVYAHVVPPEEIQIELNGEIFQPDDDPVLASLFEGVQAAVVAFGHFHYTFERFMYGMRLVNVSPCSFSAFDPDRRARYTVFAWDGEWQVERKYVEYDYRQEGVALLAGDMPNREGRAKFFK
jgi:predicted phosphodiesterase